MEEILERPREPIAFPDDHDITRAELVEQTMEFRTVPAPTRGVVRIQPFDPRRPQRGHLGARILVVPF
jgi:hypothetical protein